MTEFRKDPVTDLWVIVAPERAHRPQPAKISDLAPAQGRCPFCAGHEDDTPAEIFAFRASGSAPNRPGWSVRVVPNKYPALAVVRDGNPQAGPFYQSMPAQGVHEVIIESPAHMTNLATLDEAQIARILRAYRERMAELSRDRHWRSILVFKNQGFAAGGSLLHVHSQLVATAMIPPQLEREFAGAKAFYDAQGRCVYCEMIAREISAAIRVVWTDPDYLAFCPYASRVPYETWILPRRHVSRFEAIAPEDIPSLARVLREILRRSDHALGGPALNYVVHSGSPSPGENPFYHWHIEILPRLVQVGGFEWGSGSHINSVRPENAAQLLCQVAL